jgi:hypothetical protein
LPTKANPDYKRPKLAFRAVIWEMFISDGS